jgi:hypothetical protein
MKDIGRTTEGCYLVQMTPDEQWNFLMKTNSRD